MGPAFTARMSWVDDAQNVLRPLVFTGGERVLVKGSTPAAALRSAIGYLENRFGALAEPEHQCLPAETPPEGPALVVESGLEPRTDVDEASEESFPASDPPTSTPTTGAKVGDI